MVEAISGEIRHSRKERRRAGKYVVANEKCPLFPQYVEHIRRKLAGQTERWELT
jgi:hypothetical protein